MTAAAADWEALNSNFLAAALAWLRGRLAECCREQGRQFPQTAEPDWSMDSELLPALLVLRHRFGLSVFETKILLLCAAVELDPGIGELCARAQRADALAQPTFALCLTLFPEANWEALSPHQPLRAWRLIECGTSGRSAVITAPLHTDERIVHFLKGLNEIDERIVTLLLTASSNPASSFGLAPSQRAPVAEIIRAWQTADPPLVVLTGADTTSKLLAAECAAAEIGCILCRTTLDILPGNAADMDAFERLWRREQRLLPLAMLIEAEENDVADSSSDATLRRLLLRLNGPIALAAREPPRIARPVRAIEVVKPTRAEQEELWLAALGAEGAELASSLAAHFTVSGPVIAELVRQEATTVKGDRRTLWRACREVLRPRLDKLAQRIETRASWHDLVLPADRTDLLQQIVSQVRQHRRVHEEWGFAAQSSRGLGVSALFAGESGTGKTLAAEVLASTLELDLYRIDLSGVVSKYIGETEKNLRRLFDAAEESGAILFFDEADALFGRRSEVRDSHDRYANIEVNYLLQRIEAYRGLAILATNMRSALDPAFIRRLRFVVTFPYPGVVERQAIWKRAFPSKARVGALNWAHLGRLNLTGGNIATVALNAAFMASAEDNAVEMRHVLAAARAEYVKLDRPFRESDFLVEVTVDDPLEPERVA
jgi:hypothetical protein